MEHDQSFKLGTMRETWNSNKKDNNNNKNKTFIIIITSIWEKKENVQHEKWKINKRIQVIPIIYFKLYISHYMSCAFLLCWCSSLTFIFVFYILCVYFQQHLHHFLFPFRFFKNAHLVGVPSTSMIMCLIDHSMQGVTKIDGQTETILPILRPN